MKDVGRKRKLHKWAYPTIEVWNLPKSSCLPPNKAVIADREQKDMSCLVEDKKSTLIRPLISKTTLSSKDEAKELNQIVALRIQHVEKVQNCQTAEKSAEEPAPQVQEVHEIEDRDPASNSVDKSAAEQVQEIPEGKMIIARVYHYFKNEYEILKAFTGNHWKMNPLANYLQRTAEATGVSAQAVTMIVEDKKNSVESEHVAVQEEGDEKEPEVDSNDEGRSSPLTFDMSAGGIKIKVEHIDEKESQLDCANESEALKPVRRRATGSSVRSKPSDEEQLPFPSPIQLRVHGVMETEYKIESADDECPPTIEDDPLETGDSVDHENVAATFIKIKEESDDDTEMLTMEQSINIMICDALQTSVATVHVKAEPSSPAD
ncbi:unnamed protein product [Arctia plantaginis]|uniref:Uncharacterized protein n=1 Tax=Arctia plantaginis TaxID=874455 RepID=A0A8S1BSJ6_ARCPL|nr:unnamed protein product [Arctia plantaginis]